MAVTNGQGPPQQPHVPAWKRLGLKLKYANDTAEPPSILQHSNQSSSTSRTKQPGQRIDTDHFEDERPYKKRRTTSKPQPAALSNSASLTASPRPRISSGQSEDISHTSEAAPKVSVETEPAILAHQQSTGQIPREPFAAVEQRGKPSKRRKSVTFTGETKQNDGSSAQTFPEPTLDVASSNAAPTAIDALASAEPYAKKAKKSKAKSTVSNETDQQTRIDIKSASDPLKTEKPEYVRYLEHFHQDKASWKFNKKHQTNLLKHIFDIRILPASLTPAILGYIIGLQGAGPRNKLVEDATEVLRKIAEKEGNLEEIEAMNTLSARRTAYFQALARYIRRWEDAGSPHSEYDDEQLAAMREEEAQGRRAEAVLSALLDAELATPDTTPSQPASSMEGLQKPSVPGRGVSATDTASNSISPPKLSSRKKRKRRTDVSSDLSNTSSSDSDSTPAPRAKVKGPTTGSEALRPSTIPLPEKRKPATSRTPAYQHDNLNMSYRPQNPSQLMAMNTKATKKFFDDDLLDAAFPKKKTYRETAPKRKKGDKKARGFAYTHGDRGDESASEDEED